jgi:hypothetical protein
VSGLIVQRPRGARGWRDAPILLVTGARALADTAAAAIWAQDAIDEALAGMPRHGLLVTGDAAGPDRWALDVAGEPFDNDLSRSWERWGLDGEVRGGLVYGSELLARWIAAYALAHVERCRVPLVRNGAMVGCVAARAGRGARVVVLGLVAPWARTRGTAHTLGLARRAGLWTDERVCPAALGPREVRP